MAAPSKAALAGAVGAGVVLGVAYAASPLTMWMLAALVGVFAWAGRGLAGRERRWVWQVLAVAVALRVIAIAALFLATDHHQAASFFWDGDGVALKRRAVWIRNVWLGVPITPLFFSVAFDRLYGWTTYLYVIAYLQYWLGPAPYAIHLFNVVVFLAVAVGLFRLARSAYGRAPALLGLALLLFLPTPFFWSVSALKESLYLLLVVLAVVSVVTCVRGPGLARRIVAAVLLAVAIVTIGGVRGGGLAILSMGLVAGLVGSVVVRRVSLVLIVLLCLPFAWRRALNSPGIQARAMAQLKTSAVSHIGNVRTEGHSYKVLDQRFYSEPAANDPISTMAPVEGLRFAVRALVSFVAVPFPWQIQSMSEMAFLPQQVVWYVLVVLAVVGAVAGLRRDALVTCMLLGMSMAGAVAIALNSGNIGTMVRHRDTVVPFVVWLSALGAVATVSAGMSAGTSRRGNYVAD
jgi:hypothetical protein